MSFLLFMISLISSWTTAELTKRDEWRPRTFEKISLGKSLRVKLG